MKIYEAPSIRVFLRRYVAALPRKGRGEFSRMAQFLGVSSTLISQIVTGEKHLTMEQATKLGEYLGFNELEMDGLLFLAQFERAGTAKLKNYWQGKLTSVRESSAKISNRVQAKKVLDDTERAIFYSSAIYSSIRLFTSIGEDGKSLEEIYEYFGLSRIHAHQCLKFLLKTGLCVEENGRYRMGSQSTHLEKESPFLKQYQSVWRIRALEKIEKLSKDELMYSASVSLSQSDFKKLREKMLVFIEEFLATVHASPAEQIACFNIDFFSI